MATKRAVLIQPYSPDVTENLGDNTGQFNDQDIGKGVVYNGDQMDAAADTNEIVGFITAVEPYTKDGHSIGSVRKTGRVEALDEVGTLAVGDKVIAGTAGTLGTYALQNVKVTVAATVFTWIVVTAASGAGGVCVLERV